MELAGSIALASAALALSLIITSRILLSTPEQLGLLANQVQKLAVRIAIPLGMILVVVGFIWFPGIGSFIAVGVTLIIISITLLVQSKVLSNPNDPSLRRFGRSIRRYAIILTIATLAALIYIVVQLIIILL